MQLGLGSKLLSAIIAVSACAGAQAAMVWDEGINGDFSNDGLAPTAVTLTTGSNTILGTTGDSGQGIDRDYFTFTVPTGTTLTSLMLLNSTTISGGSSFLGLQAGPQVTGASAANLLGFVHYSNDMIGTNLLPNLVGPTSGLPSGTYSAWVQELSAPVSYGFDLVVTPVPLPGAAALLFSGLLGLAKLRRRRN